MIDRSLNKYRRIMNTTDNPITLKNMEEDIVFYKQVKIELDKL